MNNIPIESELRKIGLDEKEVKVYLSCLEFKRSSVQNIAKSVNLSRPTTYRVIESLYKKGLLTKEKKSKKNNLILAESPDKILGLLRAQKREVEEQEREFLRIISILNNKYYLTRKNEIQPYAGPEGIKFLFEDFSNTSAKKISVFFLEKNDLQNKKIEKIYKNIQKKLGKIEIRELHKKSFSISKESYIQKKKISQAISLSYGIIILSDKLTYITKNKGFVIENKKILSFLSDFFNILWKIN